jgi:hypothetical protein
MNRKKFLQQSLLTSAAITLSHSLQALSIFPTGDKGKDTPIVILCVLGGGIRNQDIWAPTKKPLCPFLYGLPKQANPYAVTLLENMVHKQGEIDHQQAITNLLSGHYHTSAPKQKNQSIIQQLIEAIIPQRKPVSVWSASHPLSRLKQLGVDPIDHTGLNSAAKKPIQTINRQIIQQCLFALKNNRPDLVVIELQGADIAHYNFSAYQNHLQQTDECLRLLWEGIQMDQNLASQTHLIITQDMGRNDFANELLDCNGLGGIDHNYSVTARETFCLMAGPKDSILSCSSVVREPVETIDIVPTIRHLLQQPQAPGYEKLPGRILELALAG